MDLLEKVYGDFVMGRAFAGRGSYELALLLSSVALLLILAGPGKYSLDALLFRFLEKKGGQKPKRCRKSRINNEEEWG